MAILERTMYDLDQQAGIAYKQRNMPAYNSLVTRINQTAASLLKMTPPVDDPNDSPDMIKAAAQGRAKLHAILDRVYAERDAALAETAETPIDPEKKT